MDFFIFFCFGFGNGDGEGDLGGGDGDLGDRGEFGGVGFFSFFFLDCMLVLDLECRIMVWLIFFGSFYWMLYFLLIKIGELVLKNIWFLIWIL